MCAMVTNWHSLFPHFVVKVGEKKHSDGWIQTGLMSTHKRCMGMAWEFIQLAVQR